MLSNCGHDENGGYSGGKAGDQTGTEWQIVPWYQYPINGWQYMIRHPDPEVRGCLTDLACKAAANNNVGYDQYERYTYWQALKACGYDPSAINYPCETDCSAGVSANVKAAGYLLGRPELQQVSSEAYTGNIRRALEAAGFEVYSEAKYLNSPDYLLAGDFLLREGWHICTNVTNGSKVDPQKGEDALISEIFANSYISETFRPPVMRYVGSDNVPVRLAPGDKAPVHPRFPKLNRGNGVIVYDRFNTGYVCVEVSAGSKTGTNCYIDAHYLTKDKP